MLASRPLLTSPGLRITVVRCPGGGGGWGPEEEVGRTCVVLVRRGVFRRRADGAPGLADPVLGYVQRPCQVQQIAHPAGGDECTSIGVPDELGQRLDRPGALLVSPAGDLAHRPVLRR